MENFDLAIIGSGIVGSSLAYYSSKKEKKILIIEKNFTGYNASGNAQGGLSPYLGKDQRLKKIHLESFLLHSKLNETIFNESGIDPCYRSKKLFHLNSDEEEKKQLNLVAGSGRELRNSIIYNEREIKNIEPKLKTAPFGALVVNNYLEVDSFNLTNALKQASINNGAKYLNFDFNISNLIINNSNFEGIKLGNEKYNVGKIAITAGPWTASILEKYLEVKIKPLKGQIIKARTNEQFPASFSWGRDYATKKMDGTLWIGTTEEDVDFLEGETEEAKTQILTSFRNTFNGFDDLEIENQTACFRPYSENNFPIIQESGEIKNLFLGTGAGRNGIKIGPSMGKRLSNMIFS